MKSIADVLAGGARWSIECADCLTILPAIGSVNQVVTDGPYGIGDNAATWDDGPYVEVLRWAGHHSLPVAFFGYPENVINWIVQLGWHHPDEWVTWYPSNAEAKAGAQSKFKLPKLVECIAIYGNTRNVRELRRERSKGGAKLAGKKALVELRRFSPNAELRGTAQLGDVWTDPSPGIGFQSGLRLHPNEKPVSLIEKLVTLTTEPDDLVLDPFCGSGTTGVACLRLGRRFIGIEKDESWAALATERLQAEEMGTTLSASRAGQLPMFGGSK